MINIFEVAETNEMIEKENLDVRTITMGISLLDCIDGDLKILNEKIYQKIYESAKDLVKTGEQISREYGIPIVNKRISVTRSGTTSPTNSRWVCSQPRTLTVNSLPLSKNTVPNIPMNGTIITKRFWNISGTHSKNRWIP